MAFHHPYGLQLVTLTFLSVPVRRIDDIIEIKGFTTTVFTGNISNINNGEKFKGAQSRYFEIFWPHTKLLLNGRKLENNTLMR